jgi:hypothetical protein
MMKEKLTDWAVKNADNFSYQMSLDVCEYKRKVLKRLEAEQLFKIECAIRDAFMDGAMYAYNKLTNPDGDVNYAEEFK